MIFFTTYESSKTFYSDIAHRIHLSNRFAIPTPVLHSLASGTAELASCLVLTPAEVIKQNAQMIRSNSGSNSIAATGGGWRNSTSIQALRMISQSGGAWGAAHRLLTGYTALVARNLPFTAIQFPMFEALRRHIWERRDQKSGITARDGSGGVGGGERKIEERRKAAVARGLLETGAVNGASAALSGAIAAVITTPTDVVKTRMMLFAGEDRAVQTEGHGQPRQEPSSQGKASAKPEASIHGSHDHKTGHAEGPTARRQNMSSMQVARLVYQERGVKGLFRGGVLRASWTALGSGLYLGTYEVAKVWLKGTEDGKDDDV